MKVPMAWVGKYEVRKQYHLGVFTLYQRNLHIGRDEDWNFIYKMDDGMIILFFWFSLSLILKTQSLVIDTFL